MSHLSTQLVDAIEKQDFDSAAKIVRGMSAYAIRQSLRYSWVCGRENGMSLGASSLRAAARTHIGHDNG